MVFRGAQDVVRTEQEQLYYADVAKAQTRIQSQDAGQIIVLQSLGTEPPADQLTAADRACADIQAVYAEWKDRAAPIGASGRADGGLGYGHGEAGRLGGGRAGGDRRRRPRDVADGGAGSSRCESAKYAIAAQRCCCPVSRLRRPADPAGHVNAEPTEPYRGQPCPSPSPP